MIIYGDSQTQGFPMKPFKRISFLENVNNRRIQVIVLYLTSTKTPV